MRPKLIEHRRIRKVKGSFSQIEHRFINGRYIDLLETQEILLYFFLTSVGDIRGISFYSSERMAAILKIGVIAIIKARDGLIRKGFIAYRDGVYQVLNLPDELGVSTERRRENGPGIMGRDSKALFSGKVIPTGSIQEA